MNCIKLFLLDLIGTFQARFLKSRLACDKTILIREILNHINKSKGVTGNVMLKIDLEKSFAHIEWSFVYHALLFFKFPPKITNHIMNCISTSNIAILINGTKTNYFSPSRCIYQGDPMSPYIFILCMKILSTYINHQVVLKNWDPFILSKKDLQFLHLFFADDLTLISKANIKSIYSIHHYLNYFFHLSG